MTEPTFRTSSYSSQGQNCVEVANLPTGTAVRDSKRPDTGHISIDTAAWRAFLASLKRDEL